MPKKSIDASISNLWRFYQRNKAASIQCKHIKHAAANAKANANARKRASRAGLVPTDEAFEVSSFRFDKIF